MAHGAISFISAAKLTQDNSPYRTVRVSRLRSLFAQSVAFQ